MTVLCELVCMKEHSNHHCSGKIPSIRRSGPHALLYELMEIDEHFALHSCIGFDEGNIFD